MRKKVSLAAGGVVLFALLSGCASSPDEPLPNLTPPAVSLPSKDEQDALYAELVKEEAERVVSMHPGVQVPPPSLVRFVLPTEWGQAMASCLTERGFPATAHRDGGIRLEPIPPEQNAAQAVANYVCATSYPVDARYLRPLNEEQQRFLYEYYIGVLIPCLESEGYAVDDHPTWQTFSADFSAQPWSPYQSVPETSEEDWIALNEKCPQTPTELYGSD